MNKWYEIYKLQIDHYNAVLAAHNSGNMNLREELARLRQLKTLHLDLWFEMQGFTRPGIVLVEYEENQFAWRRGNRLFIVHEGVVDGFTVWTPTMTPVYLPSREVQI